MPTVTPSPNPSSREPHKARQVAESFGADPELYDRTRPRYPQELADRIISTSPGLDVLDVGIGTGVSAEPFRAAGCRVLGVEVDARMAEFARRRGLDVEVAKFEEWDSAGRTFDAITAGMTWHWIDPTAGAAKAAELLRSQGRLALFWNVQQPPSELAAAFADVYQRVLPGTPFAQTPHDPVEAYGRLLDIAAAGIEATRKFSEVERWRIDWERSYCKGEWLEQVPTFGGHSQFPQATLEELLYGMGTAIDKAGGSFTMSYAALMLAATRNDDAC